MYAKSFLALDSNGRLTGARTVQAAPYAHYTCHLCGSALRYSYRSELLQLDIHFFSRILHICQRRMKSGSSATWVEENG